MKCPTSDSHKMSLKSDIDPILFFLRSEMISRLTLYTLKPNWRNFVFFLLPPICPLCIAVIFDANYVNDLGIGSVNIYQ